MKDGLRPLRSSYTDIIITRLGNKKLQLDSACPSDKQLSNFACPGQVLVSLFFI